MLFCKQKKCKYFTHSEKLMHSHYKNRHGLRLVKCHLCKKFYRKITDHHRNRHQIHPVQKCSFCNEVFKSPNTLRIHLKLFHKVKFALHEGGPLPTIEKGVDWKNLMLAKMKQLGHPSCGKVLVKNSYIVVYDEENNRPVFSFEVLTPERLKVKVKRSDLPFTEDPELSDRQICPEAVTAMKLDLGHLAASANHRLCSQDNESTFVMSNCCPMLTSTNGGGWKALETLMRELGKKWMVSVFSVPIYDDSVPKPVAVNGLLMSIPVAFAKIAYLERLGEESLSQVFIIPHKEEHVNGLESRGSLEEVEVRTGFKFLNNVNCQLSWNLNREGYKCRHCHLTFLTAVLLKVHEATHVHNCTLCSASFTTLAELEDHKTHHTPRVCVFCDREFATIQRLQDHLCHHTGEKPYHCRIADCGAEFFAPCHLKTHIDFHKGKKPFQCHICGKCFSWKHHMELHVLKHNKAAKRHVCGVCKKGFDYPGELKMHMKRHEGLSRPYKCKQCNKSFTDKGNLARHVKRNHEKPGEKRYKCSKCSKAFHEKNELEVHLRTHDGGPAKPYVCIHCGKAYAVKQSFYTHMQRNHRDASKSTSTKSK